MENYDDLEKKETYNAKCQSCGAEMVYDPKSKMLECPFCKTKKEIIKNNSEEIAFENLCKSQANNWAGETAVYVCKNCGVKEVVSKKEIAKKCSFCGTPNVVLTDELAGLKPNAVVPFEKTKNEAIDNVRIWGKKKIFAPGAFKKNVTPEGISGVYNPAFTFDTDTFSSYHGTLGKRYTKTVKVNGKSQVRTEIRYFNISGNYSFRFDDILIEASENVDQKTVNKLSPFYTNDSNEYDESFLLGFSANQYNKDGQKSWSEARVVIDNTLKRKILSQYTYDVVQSFHCSTNCSNITYKYVLLPIYVGYCNFHSKNYNFFVNGKTGKVAGKTPVSPFKVAIVVVIVLIIATIIAYFEVFKK